MGEDLELLKMIRQAETEAAELIIEARLRAEERLKEARREADRLRERIITEAREEAARSCSVSDPPPQGTPSALETETAEAVATIKREAGKRSSRVVERIVEAFWESVYTPPEPAGED